MTDQDIEEEIPRLQELFEQATEEQPEDVQAWLRDRAPDDEAMAVRLASMLEADRAVQRSGDAGLDAWTGSVAWGDEGPPRVEGFEIVGILGSGGMGSVYEARQQEPSRRVALKVSRRELSSTLLAARAIAERQALAALEHPGIARLYGTGTTLDGRPYFAMELVEGPNFRDYCQREDLGLRDAILLVVEVCEAVQHAHRRGVIHRDLKPSNVLVSTRDGRPQVKVIDFGIAKMLDPADESKLTQFGAVGTPAFMSPEQSQLIDHAIDTRSDVYSLGVLLYQTLTGETPVDAWIAKTGGAAGRRELLEISEILPCQQIKAGSGVLRSRSWSGQRLPRDLDWIVLKALQNRPDDRYDSPYALAEDLRRFLDNKPLAAGPPTTSYRLRKFARRHRWPVAVASMVLVGLLVGVIGLGVGLRRAQAAEERARSEAAAAMTVERFLVDLFSLTDPTAEPTDLTATEILRRGRTKAVAEMASQPETRARLLASIANAYDRLGMYQDSRELMDDAVIVAERLFATGEWDQQQLGSMLVAQAEVVAAAGDPQAAEQTVRRAIDLLEEVTDASERWRAKCLLSGVLRNQGRHAEALEQADQCVVGAEERWQRLEHSNENHQLLDYALRQKVWALLFLGRYEEFAVGVERGLGLARDQYGNDDLELAKWYDLYATSRLALGRFAEGLEPARELLRLRTAEYRTEDHPEVAKAYYRLGEVLRLAGEIEAAEAYLLRAIEIAEAFGPSNLLENVNYELGLFYMGQDRPARAVLHQERAVELARQLRGARHRDVATNLVGLIGARSLAGDHDGARAAGAEALEIYAEVFDQANPLQANPLVELAKAATRAGDFESAERDARRSIEIYAETLGRNHDNVFNSWSIVIDSLVGQERGEEALRVARRELERARSALEPEARGIRVLAERLERLETLTK